MIQHEFNPYVGPRPFERNARDVARFFGRSQETKEITSLIFGHPVVLVYAQSGAGKTSLFNTSIALTLENKGFDVLPLTRVGGAVPNGISPQDVKNLYVFNALLKIDIETDPQKLLSTSLSDFLDKREMAANESGQPRLRAIIFDQFEELFTYTPVRWREQRIDFFQQVADAIKADPLLRVVFVIREDFLAELDPYARDLPERLRIRYRLERLGGGAALRAIKDPIAATSRKFADGVAEGLVKQLLTTRTVDATGKMSEIEGQYVEPVQLQVACVTLWSTLKPEVTEIQQTHLQDFNVSDALSDFYKTTIDGVTKETGVREADLRNWFGKILITPMGTRSTVFRGENSTGDIANKAVDILESRHIIRAEFRAGARWYELTHDRLVEPIIASNRKWLETLSPLQQQVALWNDQGRQETWLFSEQALVEVEQWAQEHANELTDIEREFLDECRAHQKGLDEKKELESRQQKDKQRRIVTYILGSATAIMCALSVFSFMQFSLANENSAIAETQAALAEDAQTTAEADRAIAVTNANIAQEQSQLIFSNSLAAQSNALREDNFQTSILLGVEAYQRVQDINAQKVQPFGALLDAAETNPRLNRFLNGHTSAILAVAYSPDGKTVASADEGGNIFLWNAVTDKLIGQPLSGHSSAVSSIVFSPDGKTLASGSYDSTIILWDVETSQPIGQPLSGHSDVISSVAFSPDGNVLASGSWDNTIVLWNVETRQPIRQPLPGHSWYISSLAFSPDGEILASVSYDGTTILWDVATREQLNLLGLAYAVTSVAIAPNGKSVATGSCSRQQNETCTEGIVVLWDMDTGKQIGQLVGHSNSVSSVAFSPDGKTLATGSLDNTIILWDSQSQQLVEELKGHSNSVSSLAFSPDGKKLVSGSYDDTIILWDVQERQFSDQPPFGHSVVINSAAFDRDGKIFASGSCSQLENDQCVEGAITLWDVETDEQIGQTLTGHSNIVTSIVFSLDGKTLTSGSYDGTIILWDLEKGTQIGQPLTGADPVISVVFSPDGRTLVSGGYDGTITFWDWKASKVVMQIFNAHLDLVSSLAFSPDGKTLASGSYDNTINIWDVETGRQIGQSLIGHTDAITSIVFSPDGKTLASGSWDNTVILWDVETRQSDVETRQISASLIGHKSAITSIAFSGDGNILATGSLDTTVILWDVETRQAIGQPLNRHNDRVLNVAFQPGDETLVSTGYDGAINRWNINPKSLMEKACQRAGRNFTEVEWGRYFPGEPYPTCEQQTPEVVTTSTPTAIPMMTEVPAFTATPTPLASPTITPMPTPASAIVVIETLSLRAGPGTKYNVIALIRIGTRVQITGEGVQVDDSIWVPVTYNTISGWVNSSSLVRE